MSKKIEPKERVKAAALIASRIGGSTPRAQAAFLDILNGNPLQGPDLGEDKSEPGESLAASIWWGCKYLSTLQGAPQAAPVDAPPCVLRVLRDEGNDAAGVMFDVIGDLELPDYPKELIGEAALFSVTYWETKSAALDRNDYSYVMDPYAPYKDKAEDLKDLFLRCLGVRRITDRRIGNKFCFNEAALFFRKIHDLGGLH